MPAVHHILYRITFIITEQMQIEAFKDKEEKHAKGMMDAQAIKVCSPSSSNLDFKNIKTTQRPLSCSLQT